MHTEVDYAGKYNIADLIFCLSRVEAVEFDPNSFVANDVSEKKKSDKQMYKRSKAKTK